MSFLYYKACHVAWPNYHGHDKKDCIYCMDYHLIKGTHVEAKRPLHEQSVSATHHNLHRYGILWSSKIHIHWMDQELLTCWKKGFQLSLLRCFSPASHTLSPEKDLLEQECFALAKGVKKDDHLFFWICDTEVVSQQEWFALWGLFPKSCTLWIVMEDRPKIPWTYHFQNMEYSVRAQKDSLPARVVILYRRKSDKSITPLLLDLWHKRRCRAHLKHFPSDIICQSNHPFDPSQLFFGFR